MATNNTLSPLPNPFTPLAFLPPAVAEQAEASIYLSVGVLSAFIWDWLMAIPDEIKMCRKRKFTLAVVVYFLSRVGTIALCVSGLIIQAASVPPSRCHGFKIFVEGSFIVAVSSTSALFFFRVKAVYCNNKIITIFFGFLLFSLFGLCLSLLAPFGLSGKPEGPAHRRCGIIKLAGYAAAPVVVHCVIDTLVFIAISLRIMSYAIVGNTVRAHMRSFLRGDGLPTLSRCLLQDGQLYYFATIGLNIAVAVLVLAPVPTLYQSMFILPHVALNNAMACRVFRAVRLGLIRESDVGTLKSTTLRFAQASHPTTNEYPLRVHAFDGPHNNPVVVKIGSRPESGGSPERDPDGCHDGKDERWKDTSEIAFAQV